MFRMLVVIPRLLVVLFIGFTMSATLQGCGSSSSFAGNSAREGASQPPPAVTPVPQPAPAVPVPNQAITQGSFTVWADPPNPAEKQPYNVHIRVKIPPAVAQYSRSDLSGTLFGTDGYFQSINGLFGFIQPFYYVPGSGYAELIMPIPGAKQGVNDTLKVSSNLIKESQTISIWFGAPPVN